MKKKRGKKKLHRTNRQTNKTESKTERRAVSAQSTGDLLKNDVWGGVEKLVAERNEATESTLLRSLDKKKKSQIGWTVRACEPDITRLPPLFFLDLFFSFCG